jgi:hypothetical protein
MAPVNGSEISNVLISKLSKVCPRGVAKPDTGEKSYNPAAPEANRLVVRVVAATGFPSTNAD